MYAFFADWSAPTQVDINEFYAFVTETIDKHVSMGKALMVEDIVRESFQDVLKKTKNEREVLTHAFVLSTHEMPEKERCVCLCSFPSCLCSLLL